MRVSPESQTVECHPQSRQRRPCLSRGTPSYDLPDRGRKVCKRERSTSQSDGWAGLDDEERGIRCCMGLPASFPYFRLQKSCCWSSTKRTSTARGHDERKNERTASTCVAKDTQSAAAPRAAGGKRQTTAPRFRCTPVHTSKWPVHGPRVHRIERWTVNYSCIYLAWERGRPMGEGRFGVGDWVNKTGRRRGTWEGARCGNLVRMNEIQQCIPRWRVVNSRPRPRPKPEPSRAELSMCASTTRLLL